MDMVEQFDGIHATCERHADVINSVTTRTEELTDNVQQFADRTSNIDARLHNTDADVRALRSAVATMKVTCENFVLQQKLAASRIQHLEMEARSMAAQMDELHAAWDNYVLRAGNATLASLSSDIECGAGSREFPDRLLSNIIQTDDAPGRLGRSPAHSGIDDDPRLPTFDRISRAQSRAASRDPAAAAAAAKFGPQ